MSVPIPQIISIHHDETEVLRNENGTWREVLTATPSKPKIPTCVKFFFDGELVYHLEDGVIHNNVLKGLLKN